MGWEWEGEEVVVDLHLEVRQGEADLVDQGVVVGSVDLQGEEALADLLLGRLWEGITAALEGRQAEALVVDRREGEYM